MYKKNISLLIPICLIAIVCPFIFSFFVISKRNSKQVDSAFVNKNFIVYDGLMQKDKPNLESFGFRKINIIYEDSIIDRGIINYKKMDYEISKLKRNKHLICLDVESWDLRDNGHLKHAKKYITVYNYFKKNLPNREIGFYGMIPYRDLLLYQHRSGANFHARVDYVSKWKIMNDNLKNITYNNDVAFPSFYLRNKNIDMWKWVTEHQISKLKELYPRIPVYAFIWPQYWNKEFLSALHWREVLNTVYPICDGVVIWCPPFNLDDRKVIKWDANRAWWKETLRFMKEKNIYEHF